MAVDLSNSYDLQFAGIPFVPDYARRVRTHLESPEHSPASQLPAERFQPNSDLIEEIDRMMPMRYLQDFQEPGDDYPGRNLGAIALRSPSSNSPGTDLRIYDWYYPPTASRWSVFRGLMTSSMVKAVNGATRGGALPATFTMKNVPLSPFNSQPSNYTISTSMFVLPPRPIGEDGSVGSLDGLYLVTLVDERYFAQGTPATIRVDQNTTWDDLIAQLANELGIVLTYSAIPINYSRPSSDSQLWCNQETASLLLDAVAYNIGRTVVRNLDGSYVLLNPAESQTRSNNNRGNSSKVVRMAGGDIFSSGTRIPAGNLTDFRNSVVPANVNVTFPKYIQGNDPVPHFVNPRTTPQRPSVWYEESYGDVYNVSVPISSGGVNVSGLIGVSEYTIQTTAKALYSGEILAASGMVPVNESGLTALAMQLTRNYYAAQTLVALDEMYPGIVNWLPEGFHDIIWTYSVKEGRACTRVMRTEWNASIRSMQQASPAISGQTNVPVGVGGPSLALTVRDTTSGYVPVRLFSPLLSGQYVVQLQATSGTISSGIVPQGDRWRARIDNETILFEGTSAGITLSGFTSGTQQIGIVYRGIDGSLVSDHLTSSLVRSQAPKTTYGNNLLTFKKNFDVFQGTWTSGGISEAVIKIAPGGIGSGDLGSGAILSGMINSGNMSFVDWTINYITYNTYPPNNLISGPSDILSGPLPPPYFYLLSGPTYDPILSGPPPPNTYYNYTYLISGNQVFLGNAPKIALGFPYDIVINGFIGGIDGRLLYIWNTGAGKVLLKDMAAGRNSILLPLPNIDAFGSPGYVSGYTIRPRNGIILEYDGRSGVWRFDHPTFAGSDYGSVGFAGLGPAKTYQLQLLRFGSGLGYQDNNDGSANVYVLSGVGGGGGGGGGGFDYNYPNAAYPKTGLVTPAPRYYPWGRLVTKDASKVTGAADSPISGTYFALPLYIPRGGTVDKFAFCVVTFGESGDRVRLGLYDNLAGNDPYPNRLLSDSGDMFIGSGRDQLLGQFAGSGVVVTATCGVTVSPGLYWLAMTIDAHDTGMGVPSFEGASTNQFYPIYGLRGGAANAFRFMGIGTYASGGSYAPMIDPYLSGLAVSTIMEPSINFNILPLAAVSFSD